ncbi:MAG TPA: DUF481 domain-containing protein [Gemmatimonadaceae bacterium]|nr:DUF481 domain-containing protein [Gemmatimonadaceae bacterium]
MRLLRVIRGSAALAATIPVATRLHAQQLGWSSTIEASGNLLFGNARDRLVSGRVQAGRADSTLEVRSDARLTYAEAGDADGHRRVSGRTSLASLALDYVPFNRYSPFWFGSVEASLQQRIAHRFATGLGTKLTFYRHKESSASVSFALLAEHTRPLDRDNGVEQTGEWRGRWSFRGRIRQKVNGSLSLNHTTFYQPDVTRANRFTVSSTSSLAAKVASKVSLTVALNDSYDSEARARGARKNNDGQLLFGVRTEF